MAQKKQKLNLIDRIAVRYLERRASAGQTWKVSQTPPASIIRGYGGDTFTGDSIDPDTALTITTFYSGVRILAEGVGSLPLILYRRLPGGGKERAVDHSLYTLLHDAPNPEHASMVWRELLMGHLATWGNGYSQKIFNGAGQLIELWPLRPDRMSVERIDGQKVYHYKRADGSPREFSANEILHIPAFGYDGLVGYSPVTLARNAFALALAAEKFGGKFFANDARPGIVLEHPSRVGDKEAITRMKTEWQEIYQGSDNSHKIAILEEGMKVHEVGIPPEDAQFLETRKFQVAEIARILRIPLAMLDEANAPATYASVEQFMLSYVIHTLRPWLVRWEQVLSMSLLNQAERNEYFFEFLVDGLLRGDAQSRSSALQIQHQNGALTTDEWREIENRNPLPDGMGKTAWMPLNMSQMGETPPPAAAGARELYREAFLPIYEDAVARILRREAHDVLAAEKKYQNDPEKFSDWLRKFYADDHLEFWIRQLLPINEGFGRALGMPGDDGEWLELVTGLQAKQYVSRDEPIVRSAHEEKHLDATFSNLEEKAKAVAVETANTMLKLAHVPLGDGSDG